MKRAASSFFFALLLVACSGATSTDLFDSPPATSSAPTEPRSTDDAGGAPQPDAAVTVDAGSTDAAHDAGPWQSPGVFCGSGPSCKPGSELCCARLDPVFGDSFACEAASKDACSDATPLRCDDETDCPTGQLCCAVYQRGIGYRSSSCQVKCNAPTGYGNIRLCDPNAPIDECASVNATCTASTELPGFWYCE